MPEEELALSSEATTQGVHVQVWSRYSAEHSDPQRSNWFFLYTIRIANVGNQTVQLLTRQWTITDATGRVEQVQGPGVVGEQPRLEPGEDFEYTSGCPLATPFGSMEGTFQMVTEGEDDGFDAEVARFELREPHAVH
ncbi:MAG: Co2+/Mg2+ efflux protein ApaG, partial [Myxococcota bacterium]